MFSKWTEQHHTFSFCHHCTCIWTFVVAEAAIVIALGIWIIGNRWRRRWCCQCIQHLKVSQFIWLTNRLVNGWNWSDRYIIQKMFLLTFLLAVVLIFTARKNMRNNKPCSLNTFLRLSTLLEPNTVSLSIFRFLWYFVVIPGSAAIKNDSLFICMW